MKYLHLFQRHALTPSISFFSISIFKLHNVSKIHAIFQHSILIENSCTKLRWNSRICFKINFYYNLISIFEKMSKIRATLRIFFAFPPDFSMFFCIFFSIFFSIFFFFLIFSHKICTRMTPLETSSVFVSYLIRIFNPPR